MEDNGGNVKKIIILFLLVMFNPFILKAEIKSEGLIESLKKENIEIKCPNYEENDKQATIYLFKQYGESKTLNLLNYLNDLCEEYGQFFKLKSYEIYINEDNKELFANTIDYLQSRSSDVPFMVVGDSYFITFNENNKETLLKTFLRLYQSEEKVDKVEEVLTKYYRNDALIIGLFFGFIIAFVGLIVIAKVYNKEKK